MDVAGVSKYGGKLYDMDIRLLKNKIKALLVQLQELEQLIETGTGSVDAQITSILAQIDEVEADIVVLQAMLAGFAQTSGSVKTYVDGNNTAQNVNITNLLNRTSGFSNDVGSIKTYVDAGNAAQDVNIVAVVDKAGGFADTTNSIKTYVDAEDVALQAQIQVLQDQLSGFTSDLGSVKTYVDGIKTDLLTVNGMLNGFTGTTGSVKSYIDTAVSGASDAADQIVGLQVMMALTTHPVATYRFKGGATTITVPVAAPFRLPLTVSDIGTANGSTFIESLNANSLLFPINSVTSGSPSSTQVVFDLTSLKNKINLCPELTAYRAKFAAGVMGTQNSDLFAVQFRLYWSVYCQLGDYNQQITYQVSVTEEGDVMEAYAGISVIGTQNQLTALGGVSTYQDAASSSSSALSPAKALSTSTIRRFSYWILKIANSGATPVLRHDTNMSFYRIEMYLIPIKPHFDSLY